MTRADEDAAEATDVDTTWAADEEATEAAEDRVTDAADEEAAEAAEDERTTAELVARTADEDGLLDALAGTAPAFRSSRRWGPPHFS